MMVIYQKIANSLNLKKSDGKVLANKIKKIYAINNAYVIVFLYKLKEFTKDLSQNIWSKIKN